MKQGFLFRSLPRFLFLSLIIVPFIVALRLSLFLDFFSLPFVQEIEKSERKL